jgi:alpha-1,3-rhamnosyl/mannosyltransferase
MKYTLLLDGEPPDILPPGVGYVTAATRRSLSESAVGDGSRSPAYLLRMARAARKAHFDAFFFPAVYSYFPLLTRTPCVVCYHDTIGERMPELLFPRKLNHRLWQVKTALARFQMTRAMTVSRASADDLKSFLGFPEDRIDIITEGADSQFRVIDGAEASSRVRERHSIPETPDLLIYVGGFNRHKNVLRLLEAMPRVIARRPTTHLALVGSTAGAGFWDDVPELRAFVASDPTLRAHVHFTGRVPDPELVDLLNSAAALVFPSLWEGFGLPAVEAMACGVPVLASDRGSLPEVVGDAGLFFDPMEPRAISDCLIRFLEDADGRTTLAAAALARSRQYSWSRAAELAEASFRRCLEDGDSP